MNNHPQRGIPRFSFLLKKAGVLLFGVVLLLFFAWATTSVASAAPCTTTCFVDASGGNDANDGDSAAAAKQTIGAAIAQVSPGGTVQVAAGIYAENLVINKQIDLIGAGSGSDAATNTILRKNTNDDVILLEASGLSTADPLLLQNLRIEPVSEYGINVNTASVSFLKLDNVYVVGSDPLNDLESEVGLKVGTTGSITGLEIVNSAFNNLQYGWYFAKHGDWGPGGSIVSSVAVTDTDFLNNTAKGIYVEKLSDTTFSGGTVDNNGYHLAFYNARWNGGFDINLKGQEPYQNLIFNNMTFTRNGVGAQDGAALMIKGRDDGGTYGANPATLTNVQINGGTFDGNERGIRFGEPNQNNATPTNVVIRNASITNNVQTYAGTPAGTAYGGVINHTQAIVDALNNWWGAADGPGPVGPGSGDAVTAGVLFCPWLDAAPPAGVATGPSGGFATTSTDGHTTQYCTIEEAAFASSGTNQEVWVSEGNWPGETFARDYSDSPDLTIRATEKVTETVINGLDLTGSIFDGLTFQHFTFTGDHTGAYGNYHVAIDGDGTYKNLAFTDNIFNGQDVADIGALFLNRGFDGFTLHNNIFRNYANSLARPGSGVTNYSLVFAEAQGPDAGNNYIVTNNHVEDAQHLNSFEAYRWQNVRLEQNTIDGIHGRLLVWSDTTVLLQSVKILDNVMNVIAGTNDYDTTGIGVYWAGGDVDILRNTINNANTCMTIFAAGDLDMRENRLFNCATRGLLFDDEQYGIDTTVAVVRKNTFEQGPVGAENTSDTFALNICDNTFINITDRGLANPGPINKCPLEAEKYHDTNRNGQLDSGEEMLPGWEITVKQGNSTVASGTTQNDGEIAFPLDEGTYTVCETEQNGWIATTDVCQEVQVGPGRPNKVFFGNDAAELLPILECVYSSGVSSASYALFGYENTDVIKRNRPVGNDNTLAGTVNNLYPAQPTGFDPGRQTDVFWVEFSSSTLSWTLQHPITGEGGTATANLGANSCVGKLPPVPGTVIIRKDASPADGTDFSFSGTLPGGGTFALDDAENDDGDAISTSKTFASVDAGSYSVTEGVVNGWVLLDISCSEPVENSSVDITARTATIRVEPGETVDCTFTNGLPLLEIRQSGGNTAVSEDGGTDSYEIQLASQPSAPVVVNIQPDSQLTTNVSQLTFTPENWNQAQTVTVRAVDDNVDESAPGETHRGVIRHSLSSSDSNYDGTSGQSVQVEITDNDDADVAISNTSVQVSEDGAIATYSISLRTRPASAVTVNLSSGNQIQLSTTSVTFSTSDWETPKVITISAVDDALIESLAGEAHFDTVSHSVSSSDDRYDGSPVANVQVAVLDNDVAGLVLSTNNLSVTEGGTAGFDKDYYTIALTAQPTQPVTVSLTTDLQVTLLSTPTLRFDALSWSEPQTVTVQAVDDLVAEGPHTGLISHTIVSSDTFFSQIYTATAPYTLPVNVADNDSASVSISPGTVSVKEGPAGVGTTAVYSVVLTTQPVAPVSIIASAEAQSLVNGAAFAQLDFDDGNWNLVQTITVSAVDDIFIEGSHVSTITHVINSSDAEYGTLIVSNVAVNIADDDATSDPDGDTLLTEEEDLNGDGDPSNDDTDSDGTPNYLDADDDGDGIPTIDELGDADNNGTPDYLEASGEDGVRAIAPVFLPLIVK